MKIFYTILLVISLSYVGHAQSDRIYTMFVFNKLQYNPAYAGSKETLHAGAHYRHQWQGVVGAPRTITAFGHTPIAGGRSGIGLSVISDEAGLLKNTYGKLDYAYRIGLKNDHVLSVGVGVQLQNTRFDWSKAELIDNVDTSVPFGDRAKNTFNVGTGIYYSSPNFFLGASIPSLLKNTLTSAAFDDFAAIRPNYFMGGLIFPVGNTTHIRPSILVSYIKNAPVDVDFNLSVLFLEKFWIGASYRLEESIDAFVQFPLTKRIKLAIGVDYATTELNQFTQGSGEIMIEYLFSKDGEKVNNIRFF